MSSAGVSGVTYLLIVERADDLEGGAYDGWYLNQLYVFLTAEARDSKLTELEAKYPARYRLTKLDVKGEGVVFNTDLHKLAYPGDRPLVRELEAESKTP